MGMCVCGGGVDVSFMCLLCDKNGYVRRCGCDMWRWICGEVGR